MSYPRFQLARNFKFIRQNAVLTLNTTSWANMPTISTLTISAQVGDVLEAIMTSRFGDEAVAGFVDVVTEVAATPINSFATGGAALTSTSGDGIRAWVGASGTQAGSTSGSAFYTVVSGDISGGLVTVRWRCRTASASNKTMYADASAGIFFAIRNLGPVDPN